MLRGWKTDFSDQERLVLHTISGQFWRIPGLQAAAANQVRNDAGLSEDDFNIALRRLEAKRLIHINWISGGAGTESEPGTRATRVIRLEGEVLKSGLMPKRRSSTPITYTIRRTKTLAELTPADVPLGLNPEDVATDVPHLD
jgi:hypothetical protein